MYFLIFERAGGVELGPKHLFRIWVDLPCICALKNVK